MVANMMKNSKTAALDAALSGSRGPVDEIASLLGHAEGFVRRLGALDFRILSAQQRQDCAQVINRVFNAAHAFYGWTLRGVLRHRFLTAAHRAGTPAPVFRRPLPRRGTNTRGP